MCPPSHVFAKVKRGSSGREGNGDGAAKKLCGGGAVGTTKHDPRARVQSPTVETTVQYYAIGDDIVVEAFYEEEDGVNGRWLRRSALS